MKLPVQTSILRHAATVSANLMMKLVILAGLLLSAAFTARAADDNPLLGSWVYESQDADCPLAKGAPPSLVKISFAKDSQTSEFRGALSGPTDGPGGTPSTTKTLVRQYLYVPSDPQHIVTVFGTGGYTRWIVVDANHIKSDSVCHEVYRRTK